MRSARKTAFITLLLLGFVLGMPAQRKQDSTPETLYWRTLTPGIQAALEQGMGSKYCPNERYGIDVVQTADVTGDGVPEALVQYCHMGAYTSDVALMRLESDKPVLARFRGKDGKPVSPGFLQGASVKNGEGAKLLPEQHAVYAIHWNMNDSGRLQTCRVEAYVWVAQSGTFDWNGRLSKETARRACRELRQELEPR